MAGISSILTGTTRLSRHACHFLNRTTNHAYYSSAPSILEEGTEIPINYLKNKQHPVALKAEDYPDWLWDINQPPKKNWTQDEKRSRAFLKFDRSTNIKLKNFVKSPK